MSGPTAATRNLEVQPSSTRPVPLELLRASDERLAELSCEGHALAFAELVQRYQRPLISYCASIVGPDRASDAVQQAFLQAFRGMCRGATTEVRVRPWLYRVARNCAIDMVRQNGWDHEQLDPSFDGVPQPPQLLEQKERLSEMVQAVRALPERQRVALTMREVEGRSYGEIADRMGRTQAGVRQLIFRARASLR